MVITECGGITILLLAMVFFDALKQALYYKKIITLDYHQNNQYHHFQPPVTIQKTVYHHQ